jgi:hypothetical protein
LPHVSIRLAIQKTFHLDTTTIYNKRPTTTTTTTTNHHSTTATLDLTQEWQPHRGNEVLMVKSNVVSCGLVVHDDDEDEGEAI